MAIILPVFLFFVFLNPSGLAEELDRGWNVKRYFALYFVLPGMLGFLVEGGLHGRIRHVGPRQSVFCVLRNLGAGLLALVFVGAGFFGTSWFDSWRGWAVYLALLGLMVASVLLLGGFLNTRAHGRSIRSAKGVRGYLANAVVVVASGTVALLVGLAMRELADHL